MKRKESSKWPPLILGLFLCAALWAWVMSWPPVVSSPEEVATIPDYVTLTPDRVAKLDSLHRVDRSRAWVCGVDY